MNLSKKIFYLLLNTYPDITYLLSLNLVCLILVTGYACICIWRKMGIDIFLVIYQTYQQMTCITVVGYMQRLRDLIPEL